MPATDTFAWNIKKMHVVFAGSTIALLAVTFWLLGADHSEEWHDHQRTMNKIVALKQRLRLEEAKPANYESQVKALKKAIEDAEEALQNNAEYVETKSQYEEIDLKLALNEAELKTQKARVGEAAANRDLAISRGQSKEIQEQKYRIWEEQKAEELRLTLEGQQLEQELAVKAAVLKGHTEERDRLQEELKELQKNVVQIEKALYRIEPEGWFSSTKRKVMEWPIVQGFNSHLTIHQDWLPELKITLGMSKADRFDRCRTCHLGIDQVEAGNVPAFPHGEASENTVEGWVKENKFPHPYSTHPNPDLFLTASSPHPVAKFGCTICHDGNGSGTKFQNAEHGPNHAAQGAEWHEKYGYHPNHFWEYPMLPKRFTEASCLKCHHNVEELGSHPKFGNSAPKVFQGYRLIQKFGCFGCHEIHGFEGDKSIGPDLRLEPSYTEAAKQLLYDPLLRDLKPDSKATTGAGVSLQRLSELAHEIIRNPEESDAARESLIDIVRREVTAVKAAETEVLKQKKSPAERVQALRDLESRFLSAETRSLVDLFKGVQHPGKYRKVGPSLRHIREKTTRYFIRHWTEEPKRFRPTTRMPQFFKLTNQQDPHAVKLTKVEIAAIAQYLHDKSQPLELMKPAEGYQPDPKRGKVAFEERGCVACHVRGDVKGSSNQFGPDLSRVSEKIKRNADNPDFSDWLYTWIRDPQRYHARTKMPYLFLEPVTTTVTKDGMKQEVTVDPAADITAFLLQGKATFAENKPADVNNKALDELVDLYLSKILKRSQIDEFLSNEQAESFRRYPIKNLSQIKGDEIELALGTRDKRPDDRDWERIRLNYIGRRTISRYGCYGCHDIPGFEKSRPIGTTLQDWGRKDTSKLAPEHIAEYLAHHGEPDGSSTKKRALEAYKNAEADDFPSEEDRARGLAVSYFYNSLLHHGRPGFIWQKLRAPRSYDYEKIETKGFDERLRMPKFPFNERQIEEVSTFVLGLVAEPPPVKYQYIPKGPSLDRVEGERLLKKYNCVSCHMLELPKVTYWAANEQAPFYLGMDDEARRKRNAPHVLGDDLLMQMRPPREIDVNALPTRTGKDEDDDPIEQTKITFRGLKVFEPEENPDESGHMYHLWEHLDVGGLRLRPGPTPIGVPPRDVIELDPGRGGQFAEWLFARLKERHRQLGPKEANIARHKIPPVLWKEGGKVQTPWLYQFLRNPVKLRHMAILRMPRFNLSKDDAQTLANYFAAVENEPYPYQRIPQRTSQYAQRMNDLLGFPKANQKHSDYLSQSWKLLNNKALCLACHSVGGTPAQQAEGAKEAVRGPNLEHAVDRLRPDWTLLWLSDPRWITPYTQMPVNFELDKKKFTESFNGNGAVQVKAVRDALMNYHQLMEAHRGTQFEYPAQPKPGAAKSAENKKGPD